MRASRRLFRRQIASLQDVFEMIEDFLCTQDVNERSTYRLSLVVEELFTNMVRHNPDGADEISVLLEGIDGQVRVELADRDAAPFDPDDAPEVPVTAGIRERKAGGLGLHLVRSMVDDLSYDYDDVKRLMRVSLTMSLEH